ncbi:MAG: hypothetical protein RTU92_13165 [Candidatus Thorarchaeota archaeon]
MRIQSLPDIADITGYHSFVSRVVESKKIQLESDNGSLPTHSTLYRANYSLSECVLPIGEWEFVESLFPSTTITDTCFQYYALLYGDYFQFKTECIPTDSGVGWTAHIDLETGIPLRFSFWIFEDSPYESYLYTFVLMLDEPV